MCPILAKKKIKHLVSLSLWNLSDGNDQRSDSGARNVPFNITSDPIKNQQLLQELNDSQFYDCFFALSDTRSCSEPFYISEVISRTCGPEFKDITLLNYLIKDFGTYDYLSRQTRVQLTIFYRNCLGRAWQKLVSAVIHFDSLIYLGRTLSEVDLVIQNGVFLEKNSILLSFTDGIYLVPTTELKSLRFKAKNGVKYPPTDKANDPIQLVRVQMLTYDMIMKLNNLKLCIIDIKRINNQLTQSIEKSIDEMRNKKQLSLDLPELVIFNSKLLAMRTYKLKLITFRKISNLLRKRNTTLKKKYQVKKTYLDSLKLVIEDHNSLDDMAINSDVSSVNQIKFKYIDDEPRENVSIDSGSNMDTQSVSSSSNDHQNQFNSILLSISSDISDLQELYGNNLNKLNELNYKIGLELLKIFKILLQIFDIVPNASNPIEFKILNLSLSNLCYFIKYPNYGGTLDNNNQEEQNLTILSKEELQIEIDCALGYVCQLVHLISLYLLIPLKYPLITLGSFSFICDYVSNLNDKSDKVFPLHLQKNTLIFRFEYAVALLNKNIEQLMNSQGLSIPDNKNILGNLKTLLLCLASKDLL